MNRPGRPGINIAAIFRHMCSLSEFDNLNLSFILATAVFIGSLH